MTIVRWIGAFALALATPSFAADVQTLTLDAALARARESSREILASRARLEGVEAGVGAARAALLPVVGAQVKYTHNDREATLEVPESFTPPVTTRTVTIQQEDQLDGAISVSVPLLAPSAWASFGAAKKSAAAAEAETAATETDLLLGVARAFFAAAGADEIVQAMTNNLAVAQKTVDDAKARVEAGTRNRVEVTRAELSLIRAEQARIEAADARDRAYRLLATAIGMKEPFRVRAPEVAAPASSPAVVERGEVKALRLTIDANRAQATAARMRSLPTVSAFGNARYASYEGFSGEKDAWAAGVQLEWAIFDGGLRYAQRRQARSAQRQNEARLSLLDDQLRDEVSNARSAVETRSAALASATRAVALSKESLDLIRAQQDAGRATQLDLLQAQDAVVAADVQLARARFDLGLAVVELDRAAGTFTPGEVR